MRVMASLFTTATTRSLTESSSRLSRFVGACGGAGFASAFSPAAGAAVIDGRGFRLARLADQRDPAGHGAAARKHQHDDERNAASTARRSGLMPRPPPRGGAGLRVAHGGPRCPRATIASTVNSRLSRRRPRLRCMACTSRCGSMGVLGANVISAFPSPTSIFSMASARAATRIRTVSSSCSATGGSGPKRSASSAPSSATV